MSAASPFVVREHTFEGQHIREYPGALVDQEDVVRLHAKSYTPREVASGQAKGQLTIIGLHANGFHKEVYEPFLEHLYQVLKQQHGLIIGSIWFADQFNQGQSAVINDEVLGNDAAWFDHSRDVLQMVNTFRSQMRRPIVAIGHSMGGTQAVAAASYHPRIFEALVLLDPPITMKYAPTLQAMLKFTMAKQDRFWSREEAAQYIQKNPFFKAWDKAALRRYVETAFHEGPTTLNPESGMLKLKTPPHAEAHTMVRPNLEHVSVAGPEARGGTEAGNVESVTVPGGHFLPMSNPKGSADAVATFLAARIQTWQKAEAEFMSSWNAQSAAEKQRLQPEEEKVYRAGSKPWYNPHALADGGRSKL